MASLHDITAHCCPTRPRLLQCHLCPCRLPLLEALPSLPWSLPLAWGRVIRQAPASSQASQLCAFGRPSGSAVNRRVEPADGTMQPKAGDIAPSRPVPLDEVPVLTALVACPAHMQNLSSHSQRGGASCHGRDAGFRTAACSVMTRLRGISSAMPGHYLLVCNGPGQAAVCSAGASVTGGWGIGVPSQWVRLRGCQASGRPGQVHGA